MKTRTQWSLVVLLCCGVALLAAGCPKEQTESPTATVSESAASSETAAPTETTAQVDTAVIEDLYNRNCSLCHGDKLEGRPGMAPAIIGMTAHWKSAEELAKYLHDPQGYADKDERLNANRGKYSMRMPAIPTMSDAERLAMAEWILQQ